MDAEDPNGRKLIDDGVSTVEALKMRATHYETNPDATPDGDLWQESLLPIFRIGILVRVVAYSDNDDRELREAWNTAKHDEENNAIRWSTLHQKLEIVTARFRKTGSWPATTKTFVELLGPGKSATVKRWVKVAKGMHPEVRDELKRHPRMKAACLMDNMHFIPSVTNGRQLLTPVYAVKAIRVLAETLAVEPMSCPRFHNEVCKPMKLEESWQDLVKKRYGSVATNSLALARLVESLVRWPRLHLVVLRAHCGTAFIASGLNLGLSDCELLLKEFDKCRAGGLPLQAQSPQRVKLARKLRLRRKRHMI
jgi:hypothetical protein